MEYTVLARRFRPQAFGEVVGQEAIAQALQNAIAAGRVAHAYLFTGARGVGKTSTARILAKTLNCPHTQGGNPCNQCDVCRAVSEGGDVDVIEIDGASNRGIDEIRTLRANVNVRPMRCPYKIYIIDEVHMLTKEAFNALLKTLEEPPPNVKFIFATTDPQKLPETILSRCQRFDFGTIETHRIRERLSEIARAEGVEVDPAAIDLVARRANGSMRDSQSLFDQLLAFGGPKVGTADVHRLLGTAPDSRLVDMVRALTTRDKALVLTQLDATLTHGTQLGEFIDQLIACTRDLMVLTAGATEAPLLAVGEDVRPELIELGRQWGLQSILAALQILADAKQRMKYISYGRIAVELALVRIASLADLELLAETMALLKSGKVPAGPLVVGAGGGATAPPLPVPVPGTVGAPQPGLEKKNDPVPLPGLSPPAGGPIGTRLEEPEGEPAQPGPRAAAPLRPTPPPQAPEGPAGAERLEQPQEQLPPTSPHLASPAPSVTDPVDETPPGADEPAIPFEPGQEEAIWKAVLGRLPDSPRQKFWAASRPAISGPNHLVVLLPTWYSTFKENLDRSPEPLRELEGVVERVVGLPVRVTVGFDSQTQKPGTSTASPPRPAREVERRPSQTPTDPYVQRAMATFGATVMRVERLEAPPPVAEETPES